jgi:hypothetical protein
MCRIYLFTKCQMHNFFLSWIIVIDPKATKIFVCRLSFHLISHKILPRQRFYTFPLSMIIHNFRPYSGVIIFALAPEFRPPTVLLLQFVVNWKLTTWVFLQYSYNFSWKICWIVEDRNNIVTTLHLPTQYLLFLCYSHNKCRLLPSITFTNLYF